MRILKDAPIKQSDMVRLSLSIKISTELNEEIKIYARKRRLSVSNFTYRALVEYLKNNPVEEDFFIQLKEKGRKHEVLEVLEGLEGLED
jgi:hypothetical protein